MIVFLQSIVYLQLNEKMATISIELSELELDLEEDINEFESEEEDLSFEFLHCFKFKLEFFNNSIFQFISLKSSCFKEKEYPPEF
jgi:hypothetical protein